MALFNFNRKGIDASSAIKRTKKRKVSTPVRGGNNLVTTIELIRKTVNEKLGGGMDDLACVTSEEELANYIKHFKDNGCGGLDTETTGLNVVDDKIAGVNLYTPGEKGIYVPLNHVSYMTGAKLKDQLPLDVVKKYIMQLENTKLDFSNAHFDLQVLYWQMGINNIKAYWDTQLAANLLNENEPHGLKYLYEKYVKKEDTNSKQLATFGTLFRGIPFTKIPLDIAYLYAGKDPKMSYELAEFQRKYLNNTDADVVKRHLDDVYRVMIDIEMPTVPAVLDMEIKGIKLDLDLNKKLSAKYRQKKAEVEEKLKIEFNKYDKEFKEFKIKHPDLASRLSNPINISSPKQLGIFFYDMLGLKPVDREKPRGTGADILGKFDVPVAKLILEYRELDKLLGTYIDKLPTVLSKRTGKIHCTFNQYGTVTGRFSSDSPNLQNIPSHNKDIRKMFIPDDGNILIGGDYSQQEPRSLAHMSGDEKMIKAYKNGKDIYATIASYVYKVPYEECLEFNPDGTTNTIGKQRRSNLKGVVLGIIYGRGVNSIAEKLNLTKKEAQSIIDEFFTLFPKVKQFTEDSIRMARELGYVTTLSGRRRRLPDINLPRYEFKYKDKSTSDNFNPFFDTADDVENDEVPEYVQLSYTAMLEKSRFDKKRKNVILSKARTEGISIKNNTGLIAQAERQCVNSRIQGSAADMTKIAMIALHNNKRLKELGYCMLIQVHDEIIGQCPIDVVKEVKPILESCMLNAVKLVVPMSVDIDITKCWYGESLNII
ncbi:DNA polymerase [Clostridium phage phiCTP1]|uniref:DNA polymerase n=1 Tax=Clostridium phage phiCTP1 TaxID=871584 RepID=UPI0001E07842|nr:DNA polymerase [Clostridium phage phiCTP1]ADL40350.1 putative DNA polymerase [Clostridium phage phiCTP1]